MEETGMVGERVPRRVRGPERTRRRHHFREVPQISADYGRRIDGPRLAESEFPRLRDVKPRR